MTRSERVSRMMGSRNAGTGVRITNSKRKKHRLHLSWKQMVVSIIMLFVFMGSSISYVWSNFENTRIGYDLSQLKKEEMRLTEINRKLKLELATLKSPQNIERIAVKKLGFRQPSPCQIIVLP